MRQGTSGRRPRGRSHRKQHVSPRSATYDSNGPEGRVRGNAHQVYDKYLALARDATAAGDRIAAEGFYQFAEHYFRMVNDSTDPHPEGMDRSGHNRAETARGATPTVDGGADEQPMPRGNGAGREDGEAKAEQDGEDEASATPAAAEPPRRRGPRRRRPSNGASAPDTKEPQEAQTADGDVDGDVVCS